MKKLLYLFLVLGLFACNSEKEGMKLTLQVFIKEDISEKHKIISVEDLDKFESVLQILRNRAYDLAQTKPKIEVLDNTGVVLIDIPKVKDVKRAKSLLLYNGKLEFWDAFKGEEFLQFIVQANEIVKNIEDSSDEAQADSVVNPILDLVRGQGYPGGPVIATFDSRGKEEISEYLSLPDVRSLLSTEQRYVKFLWGITEVDDQGNEYSELYALKGNRENKPLLNGSVITDARQSYGMDGVSPNVSMKMNSKGAKIWEKMTEDAFNQGSQIAIVLDDIVYSAPGVTGGPISGGFSEISGSFGITEAIDLATVFRTGKLPASVVIEVIQSEIY